MDDPRSTIYLQHPSPGVIVVALTAVLAGAGGPTAIADRAGHAEGLFVAILDLSCGVPCEEVFRRVLMAARPDAFQARFVGRLQTSRAASTGVEEPIPPIDRKKGLAASHSVGVRASEFGLSPGRAACAARCNELTAMPEPLRVVDVKGAIIAIDAMGARKAIAAGIVDQGADFALALKENQEALH